MYQAKLPLGNVTNGLNGFFLKKTVPWWKMTNFANFPQLNFLPQSFLDKVFMGHCILLFILFNNFRG